MFLFKIYNCYHLKLRIIFFKYLNFQFNNCYHLKLSIIFYNYYNFKIKNNYWEIKLKKEN